MAKVSEISVALRFGGDDLEPEVVSNLLGAQPTRSAVKGEIWRLSSGKERKAKTSYWHLQVEATAPDESFDSQVTRLFSELPAQEAIWRELRRFRGDLYVGLFLNQTNEGFEINPEVTSAISKRGLEILFDIYGPSNS